MQRVDEWSFMTTVSSEVEARRFNFYRLPLYFVSVSLNLYWRYSQYLAGLFTANLMSDDLIVYFVHLWSTTFCRFVYDLDPFTKRPLRIKGIVDDYTSWSSNQSVSEFFDGVTFEILTVAIDYDQDCRITFTLRDGTTVTEPRFGSEWDRDLATLTKEQRDELRYWNIIKAHYQSFISIWPALV